MGWKASAIIIHKPGSVNSKQLLGDLGFNNLTKIEDKTFEEVTNPDDNKVYIGTYRDNLLICAPDIPMHFFENKNPETERTLTAFFPDSEICSIVLHSAVNLWGYSIIKNGKKIRSRAGSADDGTFIEIGAPLEQEKELLSKSVLDEKGNKIYFFGRYPDEPFSEDQVGENFVFAVCKRYFGEELDSADELDETILEGYSYQTSKSYQTSRKTEVQRSVKKLPRWLPYLLMFLLLLAWQLIKRMTKTN